MTSYFKNENYADGLLAAVTKTVEILNDSGEYTISQDENYVVKTDSEAAIIIMAIIIVFVLAACLLAALGDSGSGSSSGSYHSGGSSSSGGSFGGGSFGGGGASGGW